MAPLPESKNKPKPEKTSTDKKIEAARESFNSLGEALEKASKAGMSVKIEEDGITITVPEKKKQPDPKSALSIITPQEEKKIEQELKELLKRQGE